MLPILLLAAVASIMFLIDEDSVKQAQEHVVNKKTYKNLVKDLMENHGITQTEWKNNLKINKYLDGIIIGSDEGFVHLSDSKPIKLYLGNEKIKLDTWNVNEAIEKIKKLLESDNYTESNKKIMTQILNNLVKYQDYYYLKKYLKYKTLYNKLKKARN